MERRALDVLGEAVLLGESIGAHDAGDQCGLVHALLLDEQRQRPEPPPAGIVYMPVSAPLSSSTGRTVMELSSFLRAISSASSSIDTPALTWRTFDWLSISLLKGMSREALRVIFYCLVIGISPRRAGLEPLSRPPSRSRKTRATSYSRRA